MQTATLNITLPFDMKTFVKSEVEGGGYSTISEYMRTLIREKQQQKTQQETDAFLLSVMGSDEQELTDEDWTGIRRRIEERRHAQIEFEKLLLAGLDSPSIDGKTAMQMIRSHAQMLYEKKRQPI